MAGTTITLPQSNVILGAIFVAFIFWIVSQGEGTKYLQFFTKSSGTLAAQGNTGGGVIAPTNLPNPFEVTPNSGQNSQNPLLDPNFPSGYQYTPGTGGLGGAFGGNGMGGGG
jgi:hypothetical protein